MYVFTKCFLLKILLLVVAYNFRVYVYLNPFSLHPIFFLCIRNQFGNIYIQKGATSVRERMDHLYNNPDMSDLTISAEDRAWCWGQTSQEFIVSIAEMETGLV